MNSNFSPSRFRVQRAARTLREGGIVAYPTEAVFGLGCVYYNEGSVSKLIEIKRRSVGKGLAVIAASFEQLDPLVALPDGELRDEILQTWPGPVTWTLTARPGVSGLLTGGRETLAVRVTDHPVARALCSAADSPLVSTSANRSNRPPLRRALQVRREFGSDVDAVLTGPLGGRLQPTAIRDGATGRTLRQD